MFTQALIILCLFTHVAFAIDVEIIKNFLEYKHVGTVNIYHCLNKKEEIQLAGQLSENFLNIRLFHFEANITLTQNDVFLVHNQPLGFVIDGESCLEVLVDILQEFGHLRAFTLVHPTLIFMTNVSDSSEIAELFEKVTMSISTDLQIITNNDIMYDVYNPSTLHGGRVNCTIYPYWNPETRSFIRRKHEHLYWTRRNMTGLLFQTMVVLPKDFPGELSEYLSSDAEREVNTFNRFHAVLIYHIRDYYGYNLNMSVTKSWGYKQPNGSFDGMVRALELNQIDFGSSPLFVKDERFPALDYGRRTWKLQSAFLFRTPKRPASFQVFLRPLDGPVWYLTLLACIVIVVLLKISLRTEILTDQRIVDGTFEPSWSHITLFTIGALCQQGSASYPNGMSSRIAFIFIFIFTILLYQYYSASIVSILVMTPVRFIRSLRDLATSTLVLGCEDILYNRDYINKLENDSDVSLLMKRAPEGDANKFYVDPEVGLPQVARGGYAYHVELATAYPIMSRTFDEDAICSLDSIQLFQLQQMHQPLQKRSPFKEMLDYVLHRIDESGLMYRQLKHWHAKKPECIRSRPPTSSVSIEDFYPALSMLLLGILFSVFLLVCEHLVHFYATKRQHDVFVKQLRIDKQASRIHRVRH